MSRRLQQLDIENFTSFVILHLWAGNTDWGSHNWYVARMRAGPDPRWRLFVWDAETTLGLGAGDADAAEDVSFSHVVIYGVLDASLILASLLGESAGTKPTSLHRSSVISPGHWPPRPCAAVSPCSAAELRLSPSQRKRLRWLPESGSRMWRWHSGRRRCNGPLIRWRPMTERLRQLSDPEMLRQLLPEVPVSDDLPPVSPLPPGTRIALLVHQLCGVGRLAMPPSWRTSRRGA